VYFYPREILDREVLSWAFEMKGEVLTVENQAIDEDLARRLRSPGTEKSLRADAQFLPARGQRKLPVGIGV
jgi:hypothetical protein